MKKIFNILIMVIVMAFVAEAWGQAGQFSPWKAYQKVVRQSVKYQKTLPYEAREPDTSKSKSAGIRTPEERPKPAEPAKAEEETKKEKIKVIKPLPGTAETEAEKKMKEKVTVSPTKPTIKTPAPSEEMKEVKVIKETKPEAIETKKEESKKITITKEPSFKPVLEKKAVEKLEIKKAKDAELKAENSKLAQLYAWMMYLTGVYDVSKIHKILTDNATYLANNVFYFGSNEAEGKENKFEQSGFQDKNIIKELNDPMKKVSPEQIALISLFYNTLNFIKNNQDNKEINQIIEDVVKKTGLPDAKTLKDAMAGMGGAATLPPGPLQNHTSGNPKFSGAMCMGLQALAWIQDIPKDVPGPKEGRVSTTPEPGKTPNWSNGEGTDYGQVYDINECLFAVAQLRLSGGGKGEPEDTAPEPSELPAAVTPEGEEVDEQPGDSPGDQAPEQSGDFSGPGYSDEPVPGAPSIPPCAPPSEWEPDDLDALLAPEPRGGGTGKPGKTMDYLTSPAYDVWKKLTDIAVSIRNAGGAKYAPAPDSAEASSSLNDCISNSLGAFASCVASNMRDDTGFGFGCMGEKSFVSMPSGEDPCKRREGKGPIRWNILRWLGGFGGEPPAPNQRGK